MSHRCPTCPDACLSCLGLDFCRLFICVVMAFICCICGVGVAGSTLIIKGVEGFERDNNFDI